LVIPAKEEMNALPITLKELSNYNCKKIIVLRKEENGKNIFYDFYY
jgi:hypothetical protein